MRLIWAEMKLVEKLNFRRPVMDRPHRELRQRNGIMLRGLSQPTFAIKSAQIGRQVQEIASHGLNDRGPFDAATHLP
jgi:hypothetical protein